MNKLNQAIRMCIYATNALIYAETNEQYATAKLLMDGAQAAFREALADHAEKNLTMVAEPVKHEVHQEPVIWHSVLDFVDVRRDPPEQGDEANWLPLYAIPEQTINQTPAAYVEYYDEGLKRKPLYAAPVQPVKQEPVACNPSPTCARHIEGMPVGAPIYAAPVDAKAICLAIHYPDCWDTAAYPTLDSALAEVAASGKPFRCTNDDCVDVKAIRAEREWVDLTDDEIYEVCKAVPFVIIGPDYDKAVSNAVIAAFKEKNK